MRVYLPDTLFVGSDIEVYFAGGLFTSPLLAWQSYVLELVSQKLYSNWDGIVRGQFLCYAIQTGANPVRFYSSSYRMVPGPLFRAALASFLVWCVGHAL